MLDLNIERLKYARASIHKPDRVFMNRLKHWQFPDEHLEVHLQRWKGHWEIWRVPKDGCTRPCLLHTWPSLDQRALIEMERRWFVHTSRSPRELCLELDRMDERRAELKRREYETNLDAISSDNVDWWRDVARTQVPINYEVN